MATKIRPIVFKVNEPDPPAGFVMNASNATYTLDTVNDNYWVSWESPTYPDGYNGDGKQYILVNNNAYVPTSKYNNSFYYGNDIAVGGPSALSSQDINKLGTNTGVLLNNPAAGAGYGVYLTWPLAGPLEGATLEQVQAYMANVSITILDS